VDITEGEEVLLPTRERSPTIKERELLQRENKLL